ncbi:MAG: VanW family protein [Bacillota bacterium]
MTKNRWIWVLGLTTVIILTTAVGLLIFWTPTDQIVRGVAIGPIEVGGMKLAEAKAFLEARLTNLPANFDLTTTSGNHKVKRTDLVTGFDLDRSLREALAMGRGHGLWQNIQVQRQLRQSTARVPLYANLSASGLSSLQHKMAELFGVPSRAASLAVRGDTVDILPSQEGRTVERDELERAIRQALERLETKVTVPLTTVKPTPSTEELVAMGIKEKMVEFSSTFSISLAGRVHNIRTAAQALDGQIVAPGQVFSFNEVVGPADASDGYQDAIIISNGEFTSGVGGGVCQVSSTLYGAVLRANLKITERHNHSLIVTYVPPALDATVNYPVHDFRFENTSPNHILIKTETVGDKISVRLYGQRDRTTQVQVESQVIETYPAPISIIPDDTMPVGHDEVVQNGSVGYLASSYRKVYKNGALIQTEKLSQDYYSPSTRVIRTGTKPAPTVAPTTPNPGQVTPPGQGTAPEQGGTAKPGTTPGQGTTPSPGVTPNPSTTPSPSATPASGTPTGPVTKPEEKPAPKPADKPTQEEKIPN